jgi:acyl-CoA thioester hydrolase
MIENTIAFRVRYAETDQMGIAHHSNYLVWFELARVELMRSLGLSYADSEKAGYRMPVLEACIHYKRSVTFDQELKITASIFQKPRAKFKYEYKIFDDHELICKGYTIHGYMNLENKAVKPPKVFLDNINKYFNNET